MSHLLSWRRWRQRRRRPPSRLGRRATTSATPGRPRTGSRRTCAFASELRRRPIGRCRTRRPGRTTGATTRRRQAPRPSRPTKPAHCARTNGPTTDLTDARAAQRATLVAPAASARNARSAHRPFPVVDGVPKGSLVLALRVELHRRVSQNGPLLRRHGRAARGERQEETEEDPRTGSHLPLLLEVHAEPGGVGLSVLVRALREDGEIRRLDSHQDAPAKREENTSSSSREEEILSFENERIRIREHAQATAEEAHEGADGPAGREVDADTSPVDKLGSVARQAVADKSLEADGFAQNQRRARLHVTKALDTAGYDGNAEDASDERQPCTRPFEWRGREKARAGRSALVPGADREGLHLVTKSIGGAPVRQDDPQPEAGAGPSVESKRFAAVRDVDPAIADSRPGAQFGGITDDASKGFRLCIRVRRPGHSRS